LSLSGVTVTVWLDESANADVAVTKVAATRVISFLT
jgi:hypothetical protein